MRLSKKSMEDRFWEKVSIPQNLISDCWKWTAALNQKGYGWFTVSKTIGPDRAHRVAFQLVKGPIYDGQVVRHTCDNPRCVNPEHLLLGTPADNVADMLSRGRGRGHFSKGHTDTRGSKAPGAKLSEQDIPHIYKLRAEGNTVRSIAIAFNVSDAAIYKVFSRQNWAHIERPDS